MNTKRNRSTRPPLVFVAVKIPRPLWKEVKVHVAKEGITLQKVVEDSLRLYLKTSTARREKKGKA